MQVATRLSICPQTRWQSSASNWHTLSARTYWLVCLSLCTGRILNHSDFFWIISLDIIEFSHLLLFTFVIISIGFTSPYSAWERNYKVCYFQKLLVRGQLQIIKKYFCREDWHLADSLLYIIYFRSQYWTPFGTPDYFLTNFATWILISVGLRSFQKYDSK